LPCGTPSRGSPSAASGSRNAWPATPSSRPTASRPAESVPFLARRLRPVPPDPELGGRIARLIAELDADDFAAREKATRALAELGEVAEPALHEALLADPPAERRARIRRVFAARPPLASYSPRQQRALAVLEHAGTPAAWRVLAALARGAPEARLTQAARAALERLSRRPP
jgi:hypothetical protein